MANEWPANGATDWNTTMLTHLAVGHNTDGTHNQEDWTPATYAGEQSITFPNGLIFKHGKVTSAAASGTVTFGTAFPTAAISITTADFNATYLTAMVTVTDFTVADFDWAGSAGTYDGFYWQAWGY